MWPDLILGLCCECGPPWWCVNFSAFRVLSHFSRVRLCATPWTVCSLPGSSVHKILQARILEWVVMPSSRGPSRPRDQTSTSSVSWIAGGFFTVEPPGKSGSFSSELQSALEASGHMVGLLSYRTPGGQVLGLDFQPTTPGSTPPPAPGPASWELRTPPQSRPPWVEGPRANLTLTSLRRTHLTQRA